MPEYEEYSELSSRAYETFNEQEALWAQKLRNLTTGQCLLRLANDPEIRLVDVRRSAPGYLRYELPQITKHFPELLDRLEELIAWNFANDLFVTAEEVDRQAEARLQRVIHPKLTVGTNNPSPHSEDDRDPFL